MRAILAMSAVMALLAGFGTSPTLAPAAPQFTISSMMTRGPAEAPVTIVEFSDYQ